MKTIVMPKHNPLASRQIPRHKIDLRVRVTPDGHPTIHCRSNDLTKEGIGLLLPSELAVGSRALVEFALPHRPEPLRVRAFVRHCRGFRGGFEFVHLTSEERHLIRHFCMELPIR